MKWKLWERAAAVGLILSLALSCTGTIAASEDIPSRVLRLHVLANSDSAADQALKLKVRDRILKDSGVWFTNADTRAQAEAQAQAHLSDLQRQAEDELRQNGCHDRVRVSLEDTWFPTRQYGKLTFPAGTYRALRVVIGQGAGHNWWCVLFPALCLPTAEPKKDLDDVLTKPEEQLTGSQYRIQFKTVELYESLENWLKNLNF
ncbi:MULTISPECIES: stage II sporulation protein R [Caproicibacterium]|uniref:Stage II sporulation protein R n=1 Tax=Caproicibacterium argilliputei TaxID=3030016 RepID=A0AA97DCL1_9FIRM|nr:stage II sporulation protein R [Caproicibacterium argilliputei]WOC33404.1 stage II sporulation protein R [Caproicibacterium argilliputei]